MCYSETTSAITFTISFICFIYLITRKNSFDIYSGWLTIFIGLMQLVEFFLWRNQECNEINRMFSLCIIIVLYLQKLDNQRIIFGVKDEGPGIPLEFQSEIFKKFVRSGNEETRSQKGTGLGLFIAAEFIRIHGGKIRYKNNQPSGSNFEITL